MIEPKYIRTAGGVPGAGTYLRGDGTWTTPPVGAGSTSALRTPISDMTIAADSSLVMQGNLTLTAGLSLTMGAGACLKILT